MNCFIRISLILLIEFFLFSSISFAQNEEIQYSLGSHCKGTSVACSGKETPVCVSLYPSIHVELSEQNVTNKYIPSCSSEVIPKCIDKETGDIASENIVIECLELAKCEVDENEQVKAICPNGEIERCVGNDNKLSGCICEDGSDPICDQSWVTSTISSRKLD